jgi:hypothetical protein
MEADAANRDLDRRMALPAYYVAVWCLSAAMPRSDVRREVIIVADN